MLDFSIIIPVYNSEKTIKRCLDSICAQNYSSYEVILIDDGSKDKSLEICKRYEEKNRKFHVIHQANNGPSVARNIGLEFARGNWICFIDSDDYVEASYLQEIWNARIEFDADVIFIGHNKVKNNEIKSTFLPEKLQKTNMKTAIAFSDRDTFGYTWTKIIHRDCIKDIRFDPSLYLLEDEMFICQVLPNCKRIGVVNKPIYNYNVGDENSLVGRTHEEYCLICDKIYQEWQVMLEKSQELECELSKKANVFVSRCYYYAFEHQINIQKFFSQLKNTSFFKMHTERFRFDEFVRKDDYVRLKFEKKKYQFKVRISLILHGKR